MATIGRDGATLHPLLAEELDVATGRALGNAPLVWAHTEAARIVILLDQADDRTGGRR